MNCWNPPKSLPNIHSRVAFLKILKTIFLLEKLNKEFLSIHRFINDQIQKEEIKIIVKDFIRKLISAKDLQYEVYYLIGILDSLNKIREKPDYYFLTIRDFLRKIYILSVDKYLNKDSPNKILKDYLDEDVKSLFQDINNIFVFENDSIENENNELELNEISQFEEIEEERSDVSSLTD